MLPCLHEGGGPVQESGVDHHWCLRGLLLDDKLSAEAEDPTGRPGRARLSLDKKTDQAKFLASNEPFLGHFQGREGGDGVQKNDKLSLVSFSSYFNNCSMEPGHFKVAGDEKMKLPASNGPFLGHLQRREGGDRRVREDRRRKTPQLSDILKQEKEKMRI